MCCNSKSGNRAGVKSSHTHDNTPPHVTEEYVATPLPDGYWLGAFPFATNSKLPDLVGYGLGFLNKPAPINLFQNPQNINSVGWKVTEIQRLDFPVAMVAADLTGDGFNDIIISDRYGPNMDDLWDGETQDGGRVQWLRNPGDRTAQPHWEAKFIGHSTGMHRLQVGHFSSKTHFQVMACPIIRHSSDRKSPAPIIIYDPVYGPDTSVGPKSWTETIIFDTQFRLIHDMKIVPGSTNGLDVVLVAGREGIVLIYYDTSARKWEYNIVGAGLPQEQGTGNPYWGSGSVDVARVGDDSVGYIATCEAFHGNTVAVYIKKAGAKKGPESLKDSSLWTRVVIDNFGPLDPVQFSGTIHHVAAGNLERSDVDVFTIACMGAPVTRPENQGVYVYKPTDLTKGTFKRTKISNESSARIALAGYTDPGVLDVASLSYYVPGYHTGPDPPNIRLNRYNAYAQNITAKRLDEEVLLQVPRPTALSKGAVPRMPLLTVAGKKLSIVVLPPNATTKFSPKDGLKVIFGEVKMIDDHKKTVTRTIAADAKKVATTLIVSPSGDVTAGADGAVFLLIEYIPGAPQGPFKTMAELPTKNVFPPEAPADVRALQFPFIKVEDLAWGSSGLWNDFEFYNLVGFHVYFNDDAMDEIAHIQAWTLGIGETARFHNHSDKSFCEIHSCISNGGGEGGMRFFPDDYTDPIDTNKELTKEYVEKNSKLIVVPSMTEHGPLWKIQPGTHARPILRPNDTADYPWHAWLASRFGDFRLAIKPPLPASEQRYDVWLAFEFPTSAFQH